MSTTICPHCQAESPSGDAFCQSCGKALPVANTGPRVVTGEALPSSAAGRELVGEDLGKQMKKVFYTLLAVGIVQMTCAAILLGIFQAAQTTVPNAQVLLVVQFICAATFLGLAFWARKNPLPPAIVGLVLYATLVCVNVVTTLSQIGAGDRPAGRGFGGLGIGWLDIVIIALLVQGIQAAIKYRKLQQTQ